MPHKAGGGRRGPAKRISRIAGGAPTTGRRKRTGSFTSQPVMTRRRGRKGTV